MIAAGRIDDNIGSAGLGLQKRSVVERPDDRFNGVGRSCTGLRLLRTRPRTLWLAVKRDDATAAADEAARAR